MDQLMYFMKSLGAAASTTAFIVLILSFLEYSERRKAKFGVISFFTSFLIFIILLIFFESLRSLVSNDYVFYITLLITIIIIVNIIFLNGRRKILEKKWLENPSTSRYVLLNLRDTIRYCSLKKVNSPTLNDVLTIFLDAMVERLNLWIKLNSEDKYKICLAIPKANGKFDFTAKNIDIHRLNIFKTETNWKKKKKKSLFVEGLYQKEAFTRRLTPPKNKETEDDKYQNYSAPPNYNRSEVHLIIPLKDPFYEYEDDLIEDCLAVLTVAATKKKMIPEDDAQGIYNFLSPLIKGLECALLLDYMNSLEK